MNHNHKFYKELLSKNTKKTNDLVLRVLWGCLAILMILFYITKLKIFKLAPSFVCKWAILIFVLTLMLYLLRYLNVSENILKYLCIFTVLIGILYGARDGNVGIYCMYALPAIISIAYMDREFSYVISFLCYLVCIISLYYRSVFFASGNNRERWFILYSLGYTLEFVGISFGIHIAISRAESLIESLSIQNERVINMQNDIIAAFAGLVESRDANTGEHVKRTGNTVKLLIDSMVENDIYRDELDKKNANLIQMAAPLHDIGKIKIPDSILCKPARLTEEEFSKMKYHTSGGKEIIDKYLEGMEEEDFINKAREIVLSHHERWDGAGYPNNLKGEEIPLSARIMAVADVFDALISKRCYKEAMPFEEAYNIILEGSGKQFDPKIVEALMLKKEELKKLYEDIDTENDEQNIEEDVTK